LIGHVIVGSSKDPKVACTAEITLSTISLCNLNCADWDEACNEWEKDHWKPDLVMTERANWALKPKEERKQDVLKQLNQAITDWEQKVGRVMSEEEKRELVDNWGMCSRPNEEENKSKGKRKEKEEEGGEKGARPKKSPKKPKGDIAENVANFASAPNFDMETVAKMQELSTSTYQAQLAEFKEALSAQTVVIKGLEEENKRLLVENATLRAKLEASDQVSKSKEDMYEKMISLLQSPKK
jgi:hypothetical protein